MDIIIDVTLGNFFIKPQTHYDFAKVYGYREAKIQMNFLPQFGHT